MSHYERDWSPDECIATQEATKVLGRESEVCAVCGHTRNEHHPGLFETRCDGKMDWWETGNSKCKCRQFEESR
jgi:hypothetical protein